MTILLDNIPPCRTPFLRVEDHADALEEVSLHPCVRLIPEQQIDEAIETMVGTRFDRVRASSIRRPGR